MGMGQHWLFEQIERKEVWGSCVEPGVGLSGPCESFPTQDILRFFGAASLYELENSD